MNRHRAARQDRLRRLLAVMRECRAAGESFELLRHDAVAALLE